MSRAAKGSQFEREICRKLSLWWTRDARDDIFWRSSQSGGRATFRAQKGKKTFGSYGDIAAVDPLGGPLLKIFTIELKRGKSHGTPGDLEDLPAGSAIRPFERTMDQVLCGQELSGSLFWMLISRRDRRQAMIYIPAKILSVLPCHGRVSSRYCLNIRRPDHSPCTLRFVGMPFERFLRTVSPETIQTTVFPPR